MLLTQMNNELLSWIVYEFYFFLYRYHLAHMIRALKVNFFLIKIYDDH